MYNSSIALEGASVHKHNPDDVIEGDEVIRVI